MQRTFLSCSFFLLLRYAYRCVYADTCSHIAHSPSSEFLPSPFTFTFNHLKTWMICVKVSPIFSFTRWTKSPLCLHLQFIDRQYFILIRWRGEGKKTKNAGRAPIRARWPSECDNGLWGRCLKLSCEIWFLVGGYFLMIVVWVTLRSTDGPVFFSIVWFFLLPSQNILLSLQNTNVHDCFYI